MKEGGSIALSSSRPPTRSSSPTIKKPINSSSSLRTHLPRARSSSPNIKRFPCSTPTAAAASSSSSHLLRDVGEGNLPLDSTIPPASAEKSAMMCQSSASAAAAARRPSGLSADTASQAQRTQLKSQGKVMKESMASASSKKKGGKNDVQEETVAESSAMAIREKQKARREKVAIRTKRRGYYVSDLQQGRRRAAISATCRSAPQVKKHPNSPAGVSYPLMNLEEYLKERASRPCKARHIIEDMAESPCSHLAHSHTPNFVMRNQRLFYVPTTTSPAQKHHVHVSPRDEQILAKFSAHGYISPDEEDDENDDELEDRCYTDRSGCGMSLHWAPSCSKNSDGRLLPYAGGCFSGSRRRATRKKTYNSARSTSLPGSDTETAPLMTEPEPFHDSSDEDDPTDSSSESDAHVPRLIHDLPCSLFGREDVVVSEMGSNKIHAPLRRVHRDNPHNKNRSISQKYRPKTFKELIGQSMVVESLSNAILRGKIAPLYLFHGARGTGKTSAAKIFSCAMNCLSIEELRPCGICQACAAFNAGTNYDVKEVDAAGNCGIESMRIILKHICLPPTLSRYKVFIMDDCHMLTPEAWNTLLKTLEDPPDHIVFILITAYLEQLPKAAISRCQKFMFARIKDGDIILRLRELSRQENIEIDEEALQFIADQSDGSFRDAEMMLDQLSLLGKRVSLGVVREMMGLIPDHELFHLLESALSSDTVNTVENIRTLMGAGFEPLSLVSQLATLITDILAGRRRNSFITVRRDLQERLQKALRVLSDVEKQLRSCSDRTTWLTAALLQLSKTESSSRPSSRGTSVTDHSPVVFQDAVEKETTVLDSAGRRHSWGGKERESHLPFPLDYAPGEDLSNQMDGCGIPGNSVDNRIYPCDHSPHSGVSEAFHDGAAGPSFTGKMGNGKAATMSPCTMDSIWQKVLEACQPYALKQLLQAEGRLVSISVTEAYAIARLEFRSLEHKAMAESAKETISNAFREELFCPVKVEISLCRTNVSQIVSMNSAAHNSKHSFLDCQAQTKHEQASAGTKSSLRRSHSSFMKKGSFAPSPLSHSHDIEHKKTTAVYDTDSKFCSEKETQKCANDFRMYKRTGGEMSFRGHEKNTIYSMRPKEARELNSYLAVPKSMPSQWTESREDVNGYSSDSEIGERYLPGGMLCWKGSRLRDAKAQHHVLRRRRTRFLVRFMPCTKEEEEE